MDWGNDRILNQDSKSLGQDSNLGPPEYEAAALTTRPLRSVPLPCLFSFSPDVQFIILKG
jgi:hypothetical protein